MRLRRMPSPGQSRPEGLHLERVPVHEDEPAAAGHADTPPAVVPVAADAPPADPSPARWADAADAYRLRKERDAARAELADLRADHALLDAANGRLVERVRGLELTVKALTGCLPADPK